MILENPFVGLKSDENFLVKIWNLAVVCRTEVDCTGRCG